MLWARMLARVTGMVNQELLLRGQRTGSSEVRSSMGCCFHFGSVRLGCICIPRIVNHSLRGLADPLFSRRMARLRRAYE